MIEYRIYRAPLAGEDSVYLREVEGVNYTWNLISILRAEVGNVITLKDKTAKPGSSYAYRVTKVVNGIESLAPLKPGVQVVERNAVSREIKVKLNDDLSEVLYVHYPESGGGMAWRVVGNPLVYEDVFIKTYTIQNRLFEINDIEDGNYDIEIEIDRKVYRERVSGLTAQAVATGVVKFLVAHFESVEIGPDLSVTVYGKTGCISAPEFSITYYAPSVIAISHSGTPNDSDFVEFPEVTDYTDFFAYRSFYGENIEYVDSERYFSGFRPESSLWSFETLDEEDLGSGDFKIGIKHTLLKKIIGSDTIVFERTNDLGSIPNYRKSSPLTSTQLVYIPDGLTVNQGNTLFLQRVASLVNYACPKLPFTIELKSDYTLKVTERGKKIPYLVVYDTEFYNCAEFTIGTLVSCSSAHPLSGDALSINDDVYLQRTKTENLFGGYHFDANLVDLGEWGGITGSGSHIHLLVRSVATPNYCKVYVNGLYHSSISLSKFVFANGAWVADNYTIGIGNPERFETIEVKVEINGVYTKVYKKSICRSLSVNNIRINGTSVAGTYYFFTSPHFEKVENPHLLEIELGTVENPALQYNDSQPRGRDWSFQWTRKELDVVVSQYNINYPIEFHGKLAYHNIINLDTPRDTSETLYFRYRFRDNLGLNEGKFVYTVSGASGSFSDWSLCYPIMEIYKAPNAEVSISYNQTELIERGVFEYDNAYEIVRESVDTIDTYRNVLIDFDSHVSEDFLGVNPLTTHEPFLYANLADVDYNFTPIQIKTDSVEITEQPTVFKRGGRNSGVASLVPYSTQTKVITPSIAGPGHVLNNFICLASDDEVIYNADGPIHRLSSDSFGEFAAWWCSDEFVENVEKPTSYLAPWISSHKNLILSSKSNMVPAFAPYISSVINQNVYLQLPAIHGESYIEPMSDEEDLFPTKVDRELNFQVKFNSSDFTYFIWSRSNSGSVPIGGKLFWYSDGEPRGVDIRNDTDLVDLSSNSEWSGVISNLRLIVDRPCVVGKVVLANYIYDWEIDIFKRNRTSGEYELLETLYREPGLNTIGPLGIGDYNFRIKSVIINEEGKTNLIPGGFDTCQNYFTTIRETV